MKLWMPLEVGFRKGERAELMLILYRSPLTWSSLCRRFQAKFGIQPSFDALRNLMDRGFVAEHVKSYTLTTRGRAFIELLSITES